MHIILNGLQISIEDVSPSLLLFEEGAGARDDAFSATGQTLLQYKLIDVQCTKQSTRVRRTAVSPVSEFFLRKIVFAALHSQPRTALLIYLFFGRRSQTKKSDQPSWYFKIHTRVDLREIYIFSNLDGNPILNWVDVAVVTISSHFQTDLNMSQQRYVYFYSEGGY